MQITPDRLLRGSLLTAVYLLGILGIAASGGGGGGGGGDDDDGPTGISYTGNTNAAVIERSNAARLVSNIFVGQAVIQPVSGSSARSEYSSNNINGAISLAHAPSILINKFRDKLLTSISPVARRDTVRARTEIDETESCDNSDGSVHITGEVDDDFLGTLTLDHINCLDGDVILDGEVTVQILIFDPFNLLFIDAIYSFSILTLTTSNYSLSLDGSFRSRLFFGGVQTERLDISRLVSRDNSTGEMLMINNQVSMIDYDNLLTPSSFLETITGRIYDSIHGYVDFSTNLALNYSTIAQKYPNDGQILLIGNLNSGIQATVISDTHVSLNLDLDGNSTFEIVVTTSWSEFDEEPIFADGDNDGMHDSWEQDNGLDPADPSDASQDNDNDNFSNIEEYLAGTDPNIFGSHPPAADLSIELTSISNPIAGSPRYRYTVDVANHGEITAENVLVTVNLPPTVDYSFYSSAGFWTCDHVSGTVTCTRVNNLLPVGTARTIEIEVTLPLSPGNITGFASITADTTDTDLGNNTDMLITDVLPIVADVSIIGTSVIGAPAGYVIGAPAGENFIYALSVNNAGPNIARNLEVEFGLPSGFAFDSLDSGVGWSCSEAGGTVTCNSSVLGVARQVSIRIDLVAPANSGINTIDAIVTSDPDTIDPDTGNNSASLEILVGHSTSTIQAQIDAAVAGDTIIVVPEMYVGGLDFGGKDVALQSSGGPENTIIHLRSNKVSIGPGGAVQGFTITGGYGTNDSGIRVSDAGTLISGNIFENNFSQTGGQGTAIGGSYASPIIERNLFRNNTCDSSDIEWFSGVISIVWDSSPIIQNNVFSNNSCRAINLDLFVGNNPMVINNTLVSNDVGIRFNRSEIQSSKVYRNNIIVLNRIGLEVDFGTESNNPVWENNLVFNNTIDYDGIVDQSWLNGNIAIDPFFVDLTSGNFRLQTGSPAIDTGNPIGAPSIDFDGNIRPLDGDGDTVPEFDMGAFEAPAL